MPSTGLKLNAAYLLLGLSGTDSIISFALCLPAILKSIPMGIGWTSFTLAATSLAHCATVIPFGNFADRVGRRKIFMLGHLCTTIGGFLTVVAQTGILLLLSRLIIGLGEGMLMGVGLAILSTLQAKNKLPIAISRWTVYITIAHISILLLTGIWSTTNWRLAMSLIPTLSIVLMALSPILLPESKGNQETSNPIPMILLGTAFTTLLLSITQIESSGLTSNVILTLILSSSSIIGWYQLENNSRNPSFPVNLLRNRRYLGGISGAFLFAFMYKSMHIQLPRFLQIHEAMKGTLISEILLPSYLAGIITSIAIGYILARKLGTKKLVMLTGFGIASIGFLMMDQFTTLSNSFLIVASTSIATCGLYCIDIPSLDIVAKSAPNSHLGTVTASHAVFAQLGGALGIVISNGAIYIAESSWGSPNLLRETTLHTDTLIEKFGNMANQFSRSNIFMDVPSFPLSVTAFHSFVLLYALIAGLSLVVFGLVYFPARSRNRG